MSHVQNWYLTPIFSVSVNSICTHGMHKSELGCHPWVVYPSKQISLPFIPFTSFYCLSPGHPPSFTQTSSHLLTLLLSSWHSATIMVLFKIYIGLENLPAYNPSVAWPTMPHMTWPYYYLPKTSSCSSPLATWTWAISFFLIAERYQTFSSLQILTVYWNWMAFALARCVISYFSIFRS